MSKAKSNHQLPPRPIDPEVPGPVSTTVVIPTPRASTETVTRTPEPEPEARAADPSPPDALKAARPPVGTGLSPVFGQLLALVLIGLGVVGVQEALVRTGAISQASWTRSALSSVDGLAARTWMLLACILAVLVGLLLLLVVLKPRPRKALTVKASTGVFLRTRDLARIAEDLLEGTGGVTDVSTSAARRRLRVRATTLAPREENPALESELRERLAPALSALTRPPKVAVSIRNEDLT